MSHQCNDPTENHASGFTQVSQMPSRVTNSGQNWTNIKSTPFFYCYAVPQAEQSFDEIAKSFQSTRISLRIKLLRTSINNVHVH